MDVVVFGAAGPTGKLVCEQALDAGYSVRAVTRRPDPFPLAGAEALRVVRADVASGEGVDEAVADADAVLSVLGAPYQRRAVSVYSAGTRSIVEALRTRGRGRRLVVVSSGLTFPPPKGSGWFADSIVFPFLRNVPGRTLYADMRRMETYLNGCDDLDWTVMRPGRLTNGATVSAYRLDPDHPSQGTTSRADLAAAMVAELGPGGHVRAAVAPSTR